MNGAGMDYVQKKYQCLRELQSFPNLKIAEQFGHVEMTPLTIPIIPDLNSSRS